MLAESLAEVSHKIHCTDTYTCCVYYLQHHATSAGLKAFMTDTACKGMEVCPVCLLQSLVTCLSVQVCRLACGGHGYLLASGIPTLYMNCTAYQSYEGESTVLYLRTAK